MKLFLKQILTCSFILFTMCLTICMSAEQNDGKRIIVRRYSLDMDSIRHDSLKIDRDTIYIDSVLNNDTIIPEDGKWTATYYGNTYKGVRHTANGEMFNMNAMTCAAPKKYKFGTYLRVENKANGKSVVVRVTDRGGFGNRCIDLTYGAFGKISAHRTGRIKVNVYDLGNDKPV